MRPWARLLTLAICALLASQASAQVYPNIPANTFLGRLGSGNPGPPQPIPFALLSGQVLSNISGDCTVSAGGVITCTKTNGVNFGTFATQSYATPPAIGGTTPNTGSFSSLSATGNITTNITGSTQCVTANSSGVLSGTGKICSTPPGEYLLSHGTGAWVCTAPDGSIVSTVGTTTDGIAECNAAAISNNGNLRAVCPAVGNASRLDASSDITLGGAIISYNFNGCNLAFSGGKRLIFDSMVNGSSLNWNGGNIICQSNATNCVYIHPTLSVGGVYTFNPTYFSLPFVGVGCASNGAVSSVIDFDTTFGHTVSHNTAIYAGKYNIGFVDGFDGAHNCAVSGVKVENPTNGFEGFGQNDIYIGYIQGFTTNGIQSGTSALTQATQALGSNHWRFTIGATASSTNGVLTYGFLDRWEGQITVNGVTITNGINFAATTANGNWFSIPQIDATNPVVDSSTTVKNYGFFNGGGYKTGGTW